MPNRFMLPACMLITVAPCMAVPPQEGGPSILDVLQARGPCPGMETPLALYGRFVGAWEGQVLVHLPDGAQVRKSCELHVGWILEGRAIQDVWIAPARRDRQGQELPKDALYGTTVRVYDPEQQCWRITWINPFTQAQQTLVGRPVGQDIVNEGTTPDGTRIQWCFTKIQPDAFQWVGRQSRDGGKTWRVVSEFFFRRVKA